jgi:hypothetical protein
MIGQVAWNKSSLLLNLFYETHNHYNYLQWILKLKVFTKVIKMSSWKLG